MSVSQISKPDTTTIYTVGYGARTADELIALLQAYGIEYLIDVRSAPYSRFKPEFNRDALEAALKAQHIHYVFMGDALGGRPADPDCYVEGKVDYARVETKAFYQAGVTRLENAFAQGRRVVLMCSEGKPEQCHRSKLIGATLTARGLPVTHIDESNALLTQAEVVARLDGPQLALFDEPTRTSRKRYAPKEQDPTGGEEAPDG